MLRRNHRWIFAISTAAALVASAPVALAQKKGPGCGDPPGYSDTPVIPGQKWKVHDISRPHPPFVDSKPNFEPPPSDAVVLFDGKDLSHFTSHGKNGEQAPEWIVENGYVKRAGRGDLITKEKFGDIQLHAEWMIPPESTGCGQMRSNSGIILMGRYEMQVLGTYKNNVTYADGQAGAIYGQWPPLVNAARPDGEWQSYDIFFEAPKFDNGKLLKKGFVTIVLNGVVVQNHQEIVGQMAHRIYKPYEPHGPEEPLVIQNHDGSSLVRFRNIWVRRLKGYDQQ